MTYLLTAVQPKPGSAIMNHLKIGWMHLLSLKKKMSSVFTLERPIFIERHFERVKEPVDEQMQRQF